MKKTVLVMITLALLFSACAISSTGTTGRSNVLGPDELDAAIREASDEINDRVSPGTYIGIINIQSSSAALSEYIIDELIGNAVRDRVFTVLDRQRLDQIRMEQDFQYSGEVDDDFALLIGRLIGIQTIVTGTVNPLGSRYRITIRALDVQTGAVQVQFNKNIAAGETIVWLMQNSGTSASTGITQRQPAGGTQTTSQPSTGGQQTTPTTSGTTQPAVPPAVTTQQTIYRIGDTGPAGGLVFYDKGNNIGGWRYLEAAPVDLGPTNYIENPGSLPRNLYQLWERTYENTGRAVGRGIYNTEYLMEIAQARGGFTWAVRLCDNYEYNGFNDWFLPSRDELNFMYGNLYLRGLGNFRPEQYWSSTTWTDTWGSYRAWYIDFSDGRHDTQNAGQNRRLRPIRQFM